MSSSGLKRLRMMMMMLSSTRFYMKIIVQNLEHTVSYVQQSLLRHAYIKFIITKIMHSRNTTQCINILFHWNLVFQTNEHEHNQPHNTMHVTLCELGL